MKNRNEFHTQGCAYASQTCYAKKTCARMGIKMNYKHTKYASYIGYITQAIVNNLVPLLFVTFQEEFNISLANISLLIVINFGTQILTDILAAKYIDHIGYRTGAVLAHFFCFVGLLSMGILPYILPNAYLGLVLAVVLNAIGGGLIEVLISPIIESLPGDEKEASMSLLHSFYCWGQVLVVLLSTLYFITIGTKHWAYLPAIWAVIPMINTFLFLKVPLCKLVEEHEQIPMKKLISTKIFWIFILLMVCAGASELAMSQWASMFAERGLKVSKTLGDLLGPCAFAVLMGISRVFYGIKGTKINLKNALFISGALCIISYIVTAFSKNPVISLIGCALTGLSVGLMWPGVFSLAAKYFKNGGTAMFAYLALAGDVGCVSGPSLVGFITSRVTVSEKTIFHRIFNNIGTSEIGLKSGLMLAILFPFTLCVLLVFLHKQNEN